MAPARSSVNRARRDQTQHPPQPQNVSPPLDEQNSEDELFLDPLMGTPLAIYVEKDVENRDEIVELVSKHGGIVSPGYSGVSYILVDPHKESGQSLYRQYVGKKGKLVLNAQWVIRSVEAGALQTYHTNFGGCKVTGMEEVIPTVHHLPPPPPQQPEAGPSMQHLPPPTHEQMMQHQLQPEHFQQQQEPPPQHPQHQQVPAHAHGQAMGHPPPLMGHPGPIVAHPNSFAFVYSSPMEVAARGMQPPTPGPPQTWQAANGIAPSQTHLAPPAQTHIAPPPQPIPAPPPPQPEHHMMERQPGYAEEQAAWNGAYHPMQQPPPGMVQPPPAPEYAYRGYRDDQAAGWVPAPDAYYHQHYEQPYSEPPDQYMEEAGPSNAPPEPPVPAAVPVSAPAPPSVPAPEPTSKVIRGRKRTKLHPQPAPPASTLVANRHNPPARSPTPPTRVIKSTYGGNLFTADDIDYLKRYIDYCQEQGLVLSLREICERIAIKAPHHTFYSWRRYCNKHKIRLGGYAMDVGDEGDEAQPTPPPEHEAGPSEQQEEEQETPAPPSGYGPGAVTAAYRAVAADVGRGRSPTPPRALFRSTTGKGVAFTDADVIFLIRFLEYRTKQQEGKLDMVSFWKEVAAKAPHHSRASWMKFYRRHKHEFHHTSEDEPLPAPPEKKMRYSKQDDILLAKFFYGKPEGTSDKIFQQFARQHPHHPWKGWQEHHRIHKPSIDHLIQRLSVGENIDGIAD
ncbi:hypothetical protein K466DRAFT_535700 [Polyporus arcularius HHB13444]|uniref:BRCT domain-containing protein n=2 Tax=Polyporaceae TaxID=5317 RepID=A0A5C3Q0P1_9APHY|nr:hypothetical protein OH76DRAFT_1035047 [Polyporus brumalis]TFK94629.1 hypothetical protein K466DRAFT_535700 [Polyporus arcularius HHB13444]